MCSRTRLKSAYRIQADVRVLGQLGKIGSNSVPKHVDYEGHEGEVFAEEAIPETFDKEEYARTIQLIRWDDGSPDELRFCYYHRAKGASDEAWNFIPLPANMLPKTFERLLRQAKLNPNFTEALRSIEVR